MHSDSEQYSPGEDITTSPTDSGSPVTLYNPPTIWTMVRGAAINLLLPFINGMMLGFGELFAHEAAFRLGWSKTKVCEQQQCLRFIMWLAWKLSTNPTRSFLYLVVKHTQSAPASKLVKNEEYLVHQWTTLPLWSRRVPSVLKDYGRGGLKCQFNSSHWSINAIFTRHFGVEGI